MPGWQLLGGSATRWDKHHRRGAINSRRHLTGQGWRGRGRDLLGQRPPAAEEWILVPFNGFLPVTPGPTESRRRRSSPKFRRADLPLPPGEVVAKANNTPYTGCRRIWTEKGRGFCGWPTSWRAGVVWANTFNKSDPTSPSADTKNPIRPRGRRHGLASPRHDRRGLWYRAEPPSRFTSAAPSAQ